MTPDRRGSRLRTLRPALIWAGLGVVTGVPLALAATSPLLAWREPIYIVAGFAGVIGLCLLLVQPLLAGGFLPGLTLPRARQVHRAVGMLLAAAVVVHVGALWTTTPPDVVDALLFVSPTPFSVWGVLAMWAVIAAALLAAFRRRLSLRWKTWRIWHLSFALVTVAGTVLHALLIEGTMEPMTKWGLCLLVVTAMGALLWSQRRTPARTRVDA